MVKEALKPKQIKLGSQIQRKRQLLGSKRFEAFPNFQCFKIFSNAANLCKTVFDKFPVGQV